MPAFNSNTQIGQSSPFAPAFFHNGKLHMVFVANKNSRDLLHAVSTDGVTWQRLNNLGESRSSRARRCSIA